MALVLALESSVRPASLAAGRGAQVRALALEPERAHASDLALGIDALARELDFDVAELDLVVVGLGPGSYTGLRVAAATALGLAYGSGAALVGIPSFEALAFDALAPGETGDVLADARGGYLYFARYRRDAAGVTALREPCALTPEEARAAIGEGALLAGEDALAAAGLAPLDAWPEGRVRTGAAPSARALLELGVQRYERHGATPPGALVPLYLRGFEPKLRRRGAPPAPA